MDVLDVAASLFRTVEGTDGLFFLNERDASDVLGAGGSGLGPRRGGGMPAAMRCLVESELPASTLLEDILIDLTRGLALCS